MILYLWVGIAPTTDATRAFGCQDVDGDRSRSTTARPNGRAREVTPTVAPTRGFPGAFPWHRRAEWLPGLEPTSVPMADYITTLSVGSARAPRRCSLTSRPRPDHSVRAVAAATDVSEYAALRTLCHRHARRGRRPVRHPVVPVPRLLETTPLSDGKLAAFIDGVGHQERGISITAKAGMQPAEYVEALERRWAALRE